MSHQGSPIETAENPPHFGSWQWFKISLLQTFLFLFSPHTPGCLPLFYFLQLLSGPAFSPACWGIREILLSPTEQCFLLNLLSCLPLCFLNFIQQPSSTRKWNCGEYNFPHLIILRQMKPSSRSEIYPSLFYFGFFLFM